MSVPNTAKKPYKVIEIKGIIIRDYSSGFKNRPKIPNNLVRLSKKKVVAYFQQIVIENKNDPGPKKIAHALKPEKDVDGKLKLTGHYKVGEMIYF